MMKQLGINFRYDLRNMQVSEKDFFFFVCFYVYYMFIKLFLNQNTVHQSLLKAFQFYTILCVKKIMVEIGAFVGQYFC